MEGGLLLMVPLGTERQPMNNVVLCRARASVLHGFEIDSPQERVQAYADAASDHNPIHLDIVFAETTALAAPLLTAC